jgi:Fe-S oxidoreductase
VLEDAGFVVQIRSEHLCCGRPLYDFGMLDRAKQYLENVLDVLGEEIDAGTPIVILEPSCASVFRDELRNLLPENTRAMRLGSQTFLLGEFLERFRPDYRLPLLDREVLLHGHCHQKSVLSMSYDETLLRQMGVRLRTLDSGCCGMAGPFGFEKDKYEISLAIGERRLLPAVREASADTLIVTNGFSCREQIAQATGRKTFHLAEIMKLAIDSNREASNNRATTGR